MSSRLDLGCMDSEVPGFGGQGLGVMQGPQGLSLQLSVDRGGSWVVISRVYKWMPKAKACIRGLITLLIATINP